MRLLQLVTAVLLCSFDILAAASKDRLRMLDNLPLAFEANAGQADPTVKFLARSGAVTLFLTAGEAVLTAPKTRIAMKLAGANSAPPVEGVAPLPGTTNYYAGANRAGWIVHVPNYERVRYRDVYPGIDVVYYGNQRWIEYDLIVASGADPLVIRISFEGVSRMRVNSSGDLALETSAGKFVQRKPTIYQRTATGTRQIKGRYVRAGRRTVAFDVPHYDRRESLIIDPVLTYATYLGGTSDDRVNGLSVDAAGNAYVTGQTQSINFPVAPSNPQNVFRGGSADAFVTKLNAAGTAAIYSTYLGGSAVDTGEAIAVDSRGSAFIAGQTTSTDFPITPGAFQLTRRSVQSAFVSKLDSTGALIYSTYLGGSANEFPDLGDSAGGIAIDAGGNAYIIGLTTCRDFPTTASGFKKTYSGSGDAFVTKLNVAGTTVIYSTYLGGAAIDVATAIAVDSNGNAYVTGMTGSTDFPITANAYQTNNAGGTLLETDVFVTKLDPTGGVLQYSTFAGGRDDENSPAIAVDSAGSAYVAGTTFSSNFPTTAGAVRTSFGGGADDVFLFKLDPGGSKLIYSTYLGGNGNELAGGVAVDSAGNAHVTGRTNSSNFPSSSSAVQMQKSGGDDVFISKINASGSALLYSTFLGGSGTELAFGIAVDASGNVYVAGVTNSTNFPVTPGSLKTSNASGADGFVAKIDLISGVAASFGVASGNNQSGAASTGLANPISVFVKDGRGNAASGVTVTFTAANATVNPAIATTDAQGIASTRVTLGSSAGTASVTATIPGLPPVVFMATIQGPAAQIAISGVVNGASFAPNVARNSIVTIFGANMATTTVTASSAPLSVVLGGTSVAVSGKLVPLFYVSPGQINFQLPDDIALGSATLIVTSGGASSAPFAFAVAAAAPGILQFGVNRAVAQNADFTVNNSDNPAAAGTAITVYFTGQGDVDNPVPAGSATPAEPLARPVFASTAKIGGQDAQILFIGLTPGFIGLAQANIVIPSLASGDYPLVITIGGTASNSAKVTVLGN